MSRAVAFMQSPWNCSDYTRKEHLLERYDEMENETCCLQCKDPSVYFNTKEISNKTKSLNDALHYMCAFQYHYVLLDSSYTSRAGRRRKAQLSCKGQEMGREGKGRNGKAVNEQVWAAGGQKALTLPPLSA